MSKNNSSTFVFPLYAVEQSCHGHLYRWIFTKEGWEACSGEALVLDNDGTLWVDIGCPIGGSNSSATYIYEVHSLDEVKSFLLSSWESDYDDPELVDIAEGIYTIDTDDECHHSITSQFVDLFQIPKDELTKENSLLSTAEQLISEIEQLDSDKTSGIDYENPFYGESKDMRLSDLRELLEGLKNDLPNASQSNTMPPV